MIKIWILFTVIVFSLLVLGGCWYMMEDEPHVFGPKRDITEDNRMLKESRQKRLLYIQSHSELNERQKGLIESGIMGEGLNREQVMLILGEAPVEKGITSKYGADEVWMYKEQIRRRYLYFKNDELIKIEDWNETIWGLKKIN